AVASNSCAVVFSARTSAVRAGFESAGSTCTLRLLRECRWRRSEAHREGCACADHRDLAATSPSTKSIPTQDQERTMNPSAQHHGINYIEFTTTDVQKAQGFYEKAFGWNFQSWGPDYISFDKTSAGIEGGFRGGEPGQS